MSAGLRKRPLWARGLDRLRYGFGAAGKARKRAAEAAARTVAFERLPTDRDGTLSQRRYASYEAYVDHQASKLTQIERRLRRVEAEDLDSFRTAFADCAALQGRHTVLCLGARIIGEEVAREIVRIFLTARFSGEERHARRLAKIRAIEAQFFKA